MKNLRLTFIFIFLLTNSFQVFSQNNKPKTTLFPEEKFDLKEATIALEKGNCTIKGVLFTKQKTNLGFKPLFGEKIYGPNIIVMLFPVTNYFNSWYELRKKKENRRTRVSMSPEAMKITIEVKTDDYGNFIFEKLKPGLYFLQSFMAVEFYNSRNVEVDRSVNSDGSLNIYYSKENYTDNQDDRIEKFVDLNSDGEIVEIKLK